MGAGDAVKAGRLSPQPEAWPRAGDDDRELEGSKLLDVSVIYFLPKAKKISKWSIPASDKIVVFVTILL